MSDAPDHEPSDEADPIADLPAVVGIPPDTPPAAKPSTTGLQPDPLDADESASPT